VVFTFNLEIKEFKENVTVQHRSTSARIICDIKHDKTDVRQLIICYFVTVNIPLHRETIQVNIFSSS
jgi:hypothetical protein